jgi:hypothetical protein
MNCTEELEEINRVKKLIYRPPLSRKIQRVTPRASKRSPVKVFTRDEIINYAREMKK